MTETLSRPSARPPAAAAPDRTLLLEAAVAALGVAVRGLLLLGVPVLLVWWAEDRSGTSAADALRAVGQLWLVAHGAWLELPDGRLGLTPLGLVLLPLVLCRRAGQRLAEDRPERSTLRTGLALAVPYAVVAGLLTVPAESDALRPLPLVAAGSALVLAAAGTAWGVHAGRRPGTPPRLPARVRLCAAGAAGALVALCAAAALVVAVALALDGGAAVELADSTEPGAVGGLGLTAAGAALAPNAVLWVVAWFAGPGFALGTGTTVRPFAVELGPVPALPLLAALPAGPPPTWLGVLCLAVPVLAGAVGGVLIARRRLPASWAGAARDALGCGVLAGAVAGVLLALSGGPLGGGHLATVGPSAWQVAPLLSVEIAAGAGVALALACRRRG